MSEVDLEAHLNNPDANAAERCAEECAQKLSEHFDSVRIIAVRHTKGVSAVFSTGRGDFYSQLGASRDWVIRQNERTRVNERADNE